MNIILGITGGIAAYKTPDLCRKLIKAGHTVQIVMTYSAHEFVTPMALQAVSGRPVCSSLFDPATGAAMEHIELARWANIILVAPATAHCIAQLSHGLSGDLLMTLCLASRAPICLAPAMNQQMWLQSVTQENIERLRKRGFDIFGPANGEQACGETGAGRMLEPQEIVDAIAQIRPQTC